MSTSTAPRPAILERAAILRQLAIGASGIAAAIYLLIGLGTLTIGRPTSGAETDLLAFGVMMAGISGGVGVLLALVPRRAVWVAAAIVQLMALIGYVAVSGVREPPFEVWGAIIKACQLVVLVAAVYVLAHRHEVEPVWSHPVTPAGQA